MRADATLCSKMKWGESLPTSQIPGTRSLHWDGTVSTAHAPEENLQLNGDRMMFMYMFLGGWYKGFGIEGDSLPDMCKSLFDGNSHGFPLLQVCHTVHPSKLHVCLVMFMMEL